MIHTFKKAFVVTIPILFAFLFLGISYGMLMESKGFGVIWSSLISLFTFAGAAQFAMVVFLTTSLNPLIVFVIVLIINARHLFYSVSMLKRYEETGNSKWYLLFGLTDETFSLVSTLEVPTQINKKQFYIFITALNHFYWVVGTLIGALLGRVLQSEIAGLDFILTALFVSVFTLKMKKRYNVVPGLIGLGVSLIMLFIFGEHFIIPAMIVMITLLLINQKSYVRGENL
jgi:4-azaleucine resistance transporter AzlC